MKSICLFSSYFSGETIPYYIQFYLEGIAPFFDEILFITNTKDLNASSQQYFKDKSIECMFVEDEGWDFGMWYKAMQCKNISNYNRLGLINDSCVLFKKPDAFFQWLSSSDFDYCGMVDSTAVSYHLQSYFLIVNQKAIPAVIDYFRANGIKQNIQGVINTYEIGLSSYLIKHGYKIGAFYSTTAYSGEYSPTYYLVEDLINNGVPLIKKKIIFCSFRKNEIQNLIRMKFDLNPSKYIQFIQKTFVLTEDIIDFSRVGNRNSLSYYWKRMSYGVLYYLYQMARIFKRQTS